MRRSLAASPLILAAALTVLSLGSPASAQGTPSEAPSGSPSTGAVVPPAPSAGRNVSATGRVMPPASGRRPAADGGSGESSVGADMLKAQKAAAAREKAWDSKMRRTMGSICSGC
ncbi:hypothetical protein [Methylobacterium gnaphalii]|uniref:Uncharacterized protein n=1 Tax=Methylobacterium gnaphalii TaxID=1010610 RepID=A0A512JFH3_9HYPH|nr:hypothetical protein [Methylobacterium gnaphalii]GEP08697.1 hypothetical protein MGN01_05420 [Methylobacterium gnaphalii]GJD69288.1 hypothetical protein MMMDOFMJ_2217 [Methylobacterium gnaphalii]GLS47464.1 hypothetical protein GCM10007885_03080 [Methylobacterium gnaphalii]